MSFEITKVWFDEMSGEIKLAEIPPSCYEGAIWARRSAKGEEHMSETEYGFKLQITKGSTGKVEIDGYCSEVDKERLLSVALKTYDTELRPFVGLTLEEIEDIIKSNITITDSRLYDGVYAVAVDIEAALKEKNT